ncbi:CLUMA_CG001455, isoform A [Clunio marinus]|uniref:CLUMA_CG001455, isoform A n=1 Tax=Clunio marinus TaxID=568069 RepID=A0A1J1HMH9_9DIPT|nr:CLUMA_CG001455, isoform A [Clunio marinus]
MCFFYFIIAPLHHYEWNAMIIEEYDNDDHDDNSRKDAVFQPTAAHLMSTECQKKCNLARGKIL